MGNTHHYHQTQVIKYQTDPQQTEKLQKLTQQFNAQSTEIKDLKDPKKIEQAQRTLFISFLSSLSTFEQMNPIPKLKLNSIKYVSLVGQNSAGKSTLFNSILGAEQKTGVDDTTQNIKLVQQNRSPLCYFDTPGLNENVDITNAKYLKALYSIDKIFVTTAVTFKNCKRTIMVLNKIDPPELYLVRTKCDLFKKQDQFDLAATKDRALLMQWGIKREVLYISAQKPDNYRDNAKFKQLMLK